MQNFILYPVQLTREPAQIQQRMTVTNTRICCQVFLRDLMGNLDEIDDFFAFHSFHIECALTTGRWSSVE